MRRVALVAAALVVPVLPALAAGPAFAVDNVICVGAPAGSCDQNAATIMAAITVANGNAVDDTILVGPGSYSDGPYALDAGAHSLTLKGSGQGSTTITLPPSASQQTYVNASGGAHVQDLTILLAPDPNSTGDRGLVLGSGSAADNVTVSGIGTSDTTGVVSGQSQLSHATIQMPPSSDVRGLFFNLGSNTITDSSISGSVAGGSPGATDVISRVTIRSDYQGLAMESGTISIDDSVIDLGTAANSTGLVAANFNNGSGLKAINADHVTIIGGGAGSRGVWAYAAAPGALQTATITMSNSIIRGPATSLVAQAGNDGAQGGNSVALVSVSYADYQTTATPATANGTATVTPGAGNLINSDPAFVNAGGGDYHLNQGSPVVDQGDPAAGGPTLDRDGTTRVVDGDAVPGARRDMGAYELPDSVLPDTTITGGPTGLTGDATPTFAFTSEPGATFQCRVDAGAFAACASPFTTPSLANGAHAFAVRATDTASNVDATPATRSFTVDTVAPETSITTKPAKRITKKKVKLVFSSEAGATFECQVDGKAWRACTSPFKLKVKQGKHTVLIRAKDAAGNVDATPAKVKFKRVPKPQ